jgi:phosphatidylinositol alpha-1,6-mannosyltransferase
MGVLIITWNFPPRRGGIEYLISHLCAGLGKRHSVTVITTRVPREGLDENVVFRAPWRGLIVFGIYALWRGARLLLGDPAKKIVFGGSALVTPLVLILARLYGRKAVVQVHGLDVAYANALYQFLCVRRLKYCEQVIANSAYTAALAKRAGVPEHRLTVIPPGIDPQRFAARRNVEAVKDKLGLKRQRMILFVGRLARRKGVKEFIEQSFARIIREIPDVHFVVAGDNPRESLTHRDDVLSEIKGVVERLRLQDHVRLLGAVSDEQLVALYQIADVVVLPALAAKEDVEGFGIVLLEAAAAATPTVATAIGGISDAMAHGKGGVLVAPGDYDEMTRALLRLLRDDDLRKTFGKHAPKWAQDNFAWPKIISSYERALGLDVQSS